MTKGLQKAFDELLVENTWLDSPTRANARRKLDKMLFVIAQTDAADTDASLDEYYKEVEVEFNSRISARNRFNKAFSGNNA